MIRNKQKQKKKELVLSVRNVMISYRIVKPFSLTRMRRKQRKEKKFDAIKDVSFDVFKGEILGIIGKNGSGKSTLLRAIAGIYSPDKGIIDIYGATVSLMAVGVGFMDELSGRDNIYLSAMLMGFTKKQIDEKLNEIISFSGLGDFIDSPVKSYSSGMHSKLAFSISSIMESDIMLVDETLSVGDARFKKKSGKKMKELINDDERTVILVSHSSSTLRELCDRMLWLDDGVIRMNGNTDEVLDAYETYMDNGED